MVRYGTVRYDWGVRMVAVLYLNHISPHACFKRFIRTSFAGKLQARTILRGITPQSPVTQIFFINQSDGRASIWHISTFMVSLLFHSFRLATRSLTKLPRCYALSPSGQHISPADLVVLSRFPAGFSAPLHTALFFPGLHSAHPLLPMLSLHRPWRSTSGDDLRVA